jgi:ABC-type transporter Mla subunit MlaD
MSGGNGVDIAAVYQLLSQVARTVSDHTSILNDQTGVLNDHTRVLNDHTRQLADITRVVNDHTVTLHDHTRQLNDLAYGQTTLRQTLTEYHSSVIGHGILISHLEDRVRRIEHHLNLPPAEA